MFITRVPREAWSCSNRDGRATLPPSAVNNTIACCLVLAFGYDPSACNCDHFGVRQRLRRCQTVSIHNPSHRNHRGRLRYAEGSTDPLKSGKTGTASITCKNGVGRICTSLKEKNLILPVRRPLKKSLALGQTHQQEEKT